MSTWRSAMLLALFAMLPGLAPAGVATVRIPFELTGLPEGTESLVVNCYVMDSTRELGTGAGGGTAIVAVRDRAVSETVPVVLRRDTSIPLARPSTRYLCRVALQGSGAGWQAWSVEGNASPCSGTFCGLAQDASGARRAVMLSAAPGSTAFRSIDRSLPADIAAGLERPGMGTCPCGCGRTDESNSAACRPGKAAGVPKFGGAAQSSAPPRGLPANGGATPPPAPRSPKTPKPYVAPAADPGGFPAPYLDLETIRFAGNSTLTVR